MTYVENIVERLGGVRRMAAITGYPPSTIQSWKVAGSIPDRHKPVVSEKARLAGIEFTPSDFFPTAIPPEWAPPADDGRAA